MPTDDIYTLSGPDLSAAVAREVMGWELGLSRWTDGTHKNQWHPHECRNDAYRVLMRCEELGINRNVWRLLSDIAPIGLFQGDWFLMTADPAVICRAALRAVREARK